MDLHPGLNVFQGRNAQGKTSLLEAVGLVSRGRSFRTDQTSSLIRHGASTLQALASGVDAGREESLSLELHPLERVYRLDGRVVAAREYGGRLDVVVYATERLRVVYGSMRDRRLYVDRQAAGLWPSYRADLRAFERVLAQRNAALETESRDLDLWTERYLRSAVCLRQRRAAYCARLTTALANGFRPSGESYEIRAFQPASTEAEAIRLFVEELDSLRGRERAARRTLAGPHRDAVGLLLDGREVATHASAGQARSLLLALTLAVLRVHHEETGRSAVALLDDLDSELDAERAAAVCEQIVQRGQALVTSAHNGWAGSLRALGRIYDVSEGRVSCV